MKHLSLSISALALAMAGPALADTSAAELWTEWQAQAALTGQTLTADVEQTATGLILRNYATRLVQEDVVTTATTIEQIELTENADGSVSVDFSDVITVTFTFVVDPGDPPGNIELQMRHEGLDMQISGDPGARVYAYTADSLTLTDGAIWGGGDAPPEIDLTMVVTDLVTTYSLSGSDPETMRFSSEGSIGGMTMAMEITAPPSEGPGRAKVGLVLGSTSSTSSGSVLSMAALNQGATTVPPGFELDGTLSYASVAMELSFEDPFQNFTAVYSNTGGSLGMAFSEAAIGYDITSTGMQTRVTGSDIPVPVEVALASSAIAFDIPLQPADAPQDVAVRVALEGLTVSDTLWGMVDPGRAIPRDAASLVLDATGQVQLFVSLMGLQPEALVSAPGELRALTVSELRLEAGGASLTGTADMTFAPNQIVPMPVGQADLRLSGGNALLDALMAGGLVPPQQGAFVRGAIAAFARPGATPDTLETTVMFGADGTITANGIPLQ